MSTTSAWRTAWEWASDWRGTTSFWVTEVLSGLITGLLVLAFTADLNWAAVGFGAGAVIAFLSGLVGKSWGVWSEERRDYKQAIIRLASDPPSGQVVVREVPVEQPEAKSRIAELEHQLSDLEQTLQEHASTSASRRAKVERFAQYVDEQIVKIATEIDKQENQFITSYRHFDGVVTVARRTAAGINRFDSTLGSYVHAAIDEVRVSDMGLEDAYRILDAVSETKTLYDGVDAGPPF